MKFAYSLFRLCICDTATFKLQLIMSLPKGHNYSELCLLVQYIVKNKYINNKALKAYFPTK